MNVVYVAYGVKVGSSPAKDAVANFPTATVHKKGWFFSGKLY